MKMDTKRHLISTDGITFREATPYEIIVMELMEKEEKAKREAELSKELPLGVKLYIENLIEKLEARSREDDEIIETLEKYRKLYPYREFGVLEFKESSGYLTDTISDLKDSVKK
jgi:hypothetical protein